MVIRIPETVVPVKLEKYLKESITELTRTGMFVLLRKGKITINGKKAKTGRDMLKPGDTLEIRGFDPAADAGKRIRMTASIIYEDEWLLVLDKPKGIAVHPGDEQREITFIDTLREYGKGKSFTPHLVHRLDKYTSGVLITAKRKDTAVKLGKIFRRKAEGELRKIYNAIVFGTPEQKAVIDVPIDGKRAITMYSRLVSRPWKKTFINMLEVEIITGRTHQIRRHLAEKGLPVAGDDMYGSWEFNREFHQEFRYKDYALHCREIDLRHPESGEMLKLIAPVPEDMERLTIFPR